MIRIIRDYWPYIKQTIGATYSLKELKIMAGIGLAGIFILIVYLLVK